MDRSPEMGKNLCRSTAAEKRTSCTIRVHLYTLQAPSLPQNYLMLPISCLIIVIYVQEFEHDEKFKTSSIFLQIMFPDFANLLFGFLWV